MNLFRKLIIATGLLLLYNDVNAQQSLLITGEGLKALNEIYNAYDDIHSTKVAIETEQAGGKPVSTGKFSLDRLEKIFNDAEEEIRTADMIPKIDFSKFQINNEELANCYVRKQTEAKLNEHTQAYEQMISEGTKSKLQINDLALKLELIRTEIESLKKLMQDLIGVPEMGKYFTVDWFVLQNRVGPALGSLRSEVADQSEQLDKDLEAANKAMSNLKANVLLIKSSCVVEGSYSGACFDPDDGSAEDPIRLVIEKSGVGYAVKLYENNEFDDVYPLSIQNDGSISFVYNKYTYSGKLNSSYTAIENFMEQRKDLIFYRCSSLSRH